MSVFLEYLEAHSLKFLCLALTMVSPLWVRCGYWYAQKKSGYVTDIANDLKVIKEEC